MLLGKAIDLFLGEYKSTTRQAYSKGLIPMRDWIGPARELSDVKPEHLVEYFQIVGQKGWAAATLQKYVKTAKTFFNWCVRLDLLVRSPAHAVRGKKPPRSISRDKAMTDDELDALLSFLRYKAIPRDFALVLFLADTGCRRGGAAGLRLKDIDFDRLIATVTEKGDLSRKVAFSEQCAKAIRHWIAYRSVHYHIRGVYIFSEDGSPVRPENLSLAIRRACKKVGVRVLSSHSLRHRKGHQFADKRIAPSIAATALGHSDPIITVSYYYPNDWETAEQALRELMTTAPRIVNFEPKS